MTASPDGRSKTPQERQSKPSMDDRSKPSPDDRSKPSTDDRSKPFHDGPTGTSRDDQPAGLRRRAVLGVVGAGLVGSAMGTIPAAAGSTVYVLQQGDTCVPLSPLRGDVSVERFYGYEKKASRYGANGTELVALQRQATSELFLYEGPDATLSLVVTHDKPVGPETPERGGGSVTLSFRGLPTDGSWLVQDDKYDSPHNRDRWRRDGSRSTVDWTWIGGRNDGGVFGPLGDDATVTIDPAFNERAALYGEFYGGRITAWQALSGDLTDPARTDLDMSRPVTIRPGSCGT